MPLLEINQTRHVSASIRLTDSTALLVDQYAAFAKAPADNVVEESLKHVFAKDRDFQEYLKSPEAQRITPTLRVRRGNANDGAEASPKEAGIRCILGIPKHRHLWRDREHDSPPYIRGSTRAVLAPDVFRHSTPSRFVQGALRCTCLEPTT
jgi:hypothetical protein